MNTSVTMAYNINSKFDILRWKPQKSTTLDDSDGSSSISCISNVRHLLSRLFPLFRFPCRRNSYLREKAFYRRLMPIIESFAFVVHRIFHFSVVILLILTFICHELFSLTVCRYNIGFYSLAWVFLQKNIKYVRYKKNYMPEFSNKFLLLDKMTYLCTVHIETCYTLKQIYNYFI